MVLKIDTTAISNQGVMIANDATSDLANAPNLGNSVTNEIPLVPSILENPLTQFSKNITDALQKVLQQRLDMGKALQGKASDTELLELRTANQFSYHGSQGGLVPGN